MRKVFSSNEVSETALVRDALLQRGVEVTVLNEYSGQSAVPEFRPPAELWVRHDSDYENARRIVTNTITTLDSKFEGPTWICLGCKEENPPSFESCWNCGREQA